MSQVQRGILPGEWFVVERSSKIAIIRLLELGPKRERMYRSVTWDADPERRVLIGYFPNLRMAVGVTWATWMRANAEKSPRPGR